MGSQPVLKDFVRAGVSNDQSQFGRPTEINQGEVDKVNDFLQTYPRSSVRSVAEVL